MPCLCYEPGDYTLTGNGASILENTSLTWFLTTDGLLGTPPDLPDMPNGNLNQMFWKLLQNDGAIVNFIYNAFSRTYGVELANAPAVGVIGSMTGAPAEPGNGAVHTIIYNDYEVTYRYNLEDEVWVEIARAEKVATIAQVRQKKITTALTEGVTEVPFTIPTTDDNDDLFAFNIDDLALLYINNIDDESPVIGVVPGYNVSGGVIRIVLSAAIPAESEYELVAIFRRTIVS